MQSLGSIPPATLTTRLTELEQAGILERATVAPPAADGVPADGARRGAARLIAAARRTQLSDC
jgi:hypothetical protein